MKIGLTYIVLSFVLVTALVAQQTPAPKQTTAYSIVGATAHIGNGTVIENALIVFSNGTLTYVGKGDTTAQKGTVINAEGKHVYPGFIAADTSLGLAEIDAVKATRDFDETGSFLPHIRSLIAYNTESKIVESMRPNGVLMAQISPRGGVIPGTSSVVQLDAWNWEDAAIKIDDGIHLNWPTIFTDNKGWFGKYRTTKPNKTYKTSIEEIKTFFNHAKTYLNGHSKNSKSLPYESLRGLFNGTQKLFINVVGEQCITDAIETFKALGIKRMVLVHGYGAENVADLLKENNIPVIIDRAHKLPENADDDYDYPYRRAKILADKGILITLGMQGQMERMNTRNLPFYAGTYAAYGLEKEKALELITLNAAKILGISDKVGSLEVGKDATLFISEGDALDMRTNIISNAFIQGRKISLESHQTKLWKRYSNKYKNQ